MHAKRFFIFKNSIMQDKLLSEQIPTSYYCMHIYDPIYQDELAIVWADFIGCDHHGSDH
jgi:hypothetical protein